MREDYYCVLFESNSEAAEDILRIVVNTYPLIGY